MMRSCILISIILMSVWIGSSGCGPTLEERKRQAATQYEIGVSELRQGRLVEAFKALERAKKFDPDDPKVYDGLGLIYWYQKQYEEATLEFKKAIRLNPNFTDAHNHLGATYAQMKKWDEAIEEFKLAVNDPFYGALDLAFYHLGSALLEKGENVKALDELRKAIQIRPNFSRALDKYGVALYRMNRYQEAVKQFKKAIESAQILTITAESLRNLSDAGLPEEVILKLRLLEDQTIPDVQMFLKAVVDHIGKEPASKYQELILQYAESTITYVDPYLNLGIVYAQQGKREDAITQFKLVLEYSNDEALTTSAKRYLEALE